MMIYIDIPVKDNTIPRLCEMTSEIQRAQTAMEATTMWDQQESCDDVESGKHLPDYLLGHTYLQYSTMWGSAKAKLVFKSNNYC